ncbi:hypothetical protein Tco_0294637 [Tanacetum coccineum]
MTKVIKGEFEKNKYIKVEDDSLACDSPLEVFNYEIGRLSKMDDDLFTYEVEIVNIPCDLRVDDDSEHEADDMGFDPSDIAFTEWLGSKFFNYKTIDHYTMKALWIYWIREDDTDEEFSDNEDEIAEVFRIDTNIFDYETPILPRDWIMNGIRNVPWLLMRKPWTWDMEFGQEPKPSYITYNLYNYKTRSTEWYGSLEDSELKDEALRNKAIMEGFIKDDDDESSYEQMRRWDIYTNYGDTYKTNHDDNEREELCEVHEPLVCTIQRFEMIKYSFGQGEEYVAIKEDEYDNLARTSNNACRTYQEIFRMMDEGWMDLVKEISTNIGREFTNLEILKCWSLETSRRLSGYAVLICWDEYDVLDRELDTPYPVEVDTPYSTVDQNSVMAISVISISSDSSEDSVGTPAGRVILFGTIPTTIPDTTPVITPPATQTDTPVIPTETPIIAPTIPPSPDYTPASPDYSPASDSESDPSEDPSSDHIPPLPATSPFLSSDDDPTDSDTPDTPSSPTHDTPFTEITASTQRSPIIPRRRVMLLASGQPIPYGRPYRYHLNGPVHMMTARKRVGPLPTHRLAERHSANHSSSDSSSEASSDFHSDASSDSSSRHPLSDHSSPDLPSTSAGPSRKRRRSPMTSVPALSPVSGALSPVRADLIPSPKRVRDSGYSTDVEVDPRETSLRDDAIVRVSDEPHLEQDSDPEVQAEIDEYETETGVRGPVEVRVERVTHPVMPEDIPEPAQEGSVEVTYETLGDLVQRFHDHTQAIPVHRIQTIEGVQREQGHRIVGVESAIIALTERIAELESDNRRLRGTMSVESQRVDRLQYGMSRMQRELRQILRFYDRVRVGVGRLEACARKHMGYVLRNVR